MTNSIIESRRIEEKLNKPYRDACSEMAKGLHIKRLNKLHTIDRNENIDKKL